MFSKKEKGVVKSVVILFMFIFIMSSYSWGELLFEKDEYASRRQKLMDMIPDGAAIILGAYRPTGYKAFFQNNNFMYFCGVEIPNSILIIDGKNRESILFFTISEREAKGEGISIDLVKDPEEVTGIERFYPRERFSSYLSRMSSRMDVFYTSYKPQELERECTNEKFRILQSDMTMNLWDGRLTRELRFVSLLQERFPQMEIKDCSSMIRDLRMIKTPAEIEIIKKAGQIGVKAHNELMRSTEVGMYEYKISSLFEYLCKKEGSNELSYYTIISSAENHPYLHYHKYDRLLEDGDFIVIDAGPDYGYYDVDITISYPANGHFTARQREVYQAAYEVQKTCMSLYKPGVTREEVKEKVKTILKEKGYDLSKDVLKKRTIIETGGFTHFVGMAVHDVGGGPANWGTLKPGMVFACDIYAAFPGQKLGVRIEDTVLITEDGCQNLTRGIPRSIDEIEKLMKEKGLVRTLKEKGLY